MSETSIFMFVMTYCCNNIFILTFFFVFTIAVYLKQKNFCLDLYSRVLFNISRGFNFANWLLVDFSRGFNFANLSFINILYILVFSCFVLQIIVCESQNSYPNFSIFQIAFFEHKRLNSRRNA